MPIYPYLCPHCNRIYDFLSRTVSPSRAPVCPRCGAVDLAKQVARFAVVRRSGGGDDDGSDGDAFGKGGDPLAAPGAAAEMERLMADAEHMDEDNPRELGRFMRRMTELAGEPIGPEMHEALRRLEAGEDPDRIEDDMGDLMADLPADGLREGAAGDAAFGGASVGALGGDAGPGGGVGAAGEAAGGAPGSAGWAKRGRPVKDDGLYEL